MRPAMMRREVSGPGEGPAVRIGFCAEAVDGGLEFDDRADTSCFSLCRVSQRIPSRKSQRSRSSPSKKYSVRATLLIPFPQQKWNQQPPNCQQFREVSK
jgi:hypothetical protein